MEEEAVNKALTIRTYKAKDVPIALDMLMNALPQLPNYAMITADRARIEYVLRNNIDNAVSFAGWVVCDTQDIPRGCGAGWCVKSLMSNDLVADDVFLWVEPEYRTLRNANLLIQTYVEWAKARGAKLIRASHTGGSFQPGTKDYELYNALLERQGFKPVGTVYHLSTYGDK